MEKTKGDNIQPFIADMGEKPSPEYQAYLGREIWNGLDFIKENPDKMIPKYEIWKKYSLEY